MEGIRKLDVSGSVAVVSEEREMPYVRCYLPGYIAGKVTEKALAYRPPRFFEKNGVELMLGRRAVSLDTKERRVLLDDGTTLRYNKLLLATGSSAVLQGLPGTELKGVHVLRTLDDARNIAVEAIPGRKALVMGGGLVGVGTAIALHQRGMSVHLVVASSQVLSQNIDPAAAEIVAEHLRHNGIDLLLETDVVEIFGQVRAGGARLSDGRVLECDLVVSAKGVRMNYELAERAGLAVKRGVTVDERMRTSAPQVFAAGDVAEAKDYLTGHNSTLTIWPMASEQGRVAGTNMAGGDAVYLGGVQMSTVEFLGLSVVSIGDAREPKYPSILRSVVESDAVAKTYRRVIFQEGKVIGAIMVGASEKSGALTGIPCTRVDVRTVRGLLLKDDLDFGKLQDALLISASPPPPRPP